LTCYTKPKREQLYEAVGYAQTAKRLVFPVNSYQFLTSSFLDVRGNSAVIEVVKRRKDHAIASAPRSTVCSSLQDLVYFVTATGSGLAEDRLLNSGQVSSLSTQTAAG